MDINLASPANFSNEKQNARGRPKTQKNIRTKKV